QLRITRLIGKHDRIRTAPRRSTSPTPTWCLQYGAAAQKNIAGFSESTLNSVRTKDLGEIGQALSSLVVELKGFGKEEDEKGIFGFFKKKKNELEAMKVAYTKAEANVDKIAEVLEGHQVTLMKDIAMLDQMYELNTKYYKELTMYILAGKKRLNQVRANELEQLRQKAAQSGTQEDAQAYNDLTNMCSRFEKKLHDLELTRMISIQMGPQTRLIQNNDTLMLEKIQSSLVNTIPLWKSQMVLSLGLEHSRQATAAQSAVTNMTNELLKKNADMLKMGTIETAREAERSRGGHPDPPAHQSAAHLHTWMRSMNIQREGAQKRREAEAGLGRIEGQLKQKLLELQVLNSAYPTRFEIRRETCGEISGNPHRRCVWCWRWSLSRPSCWVSHRPRFQARRRWRARFAHRRGSPGLPDITANPPTVARTWIAG
ncbi:MAG: toxic anion resistance protein, partial [Flavonifractor plautii]